MQNEYPISQHPLLKLIEYCLFNDIKVKLQDTACSYVYKQPISIILHTVGYRTSYSTKLPWQASSCGSLTTIKSALYLRCMYLTTSHYYLQLNIQFL